MDKALAAALPRKRPYTLIEAAFSYQLDLNNGKCRSFRAYSRIWGWTLKKVIGFIRNTQGTKTEQARNTQETVKFSWVNLLQGSRIQAGDKQETKTEQARNTTIKTRTDLRNNIKDSLSETKVSDGTSAVTSKRRKPTITPEQLEALYKAFNGTEDKVRLFIANLAGENKTGTISASREASILTALTKLMNEAGIDRFEYGLDEANIRGISNLNYLKKAMQSYGRQPLQQGGNYDW